MSAELAATVRAECHFERQFIGRWMHFDDDADSATMFDVSSGEIRSSALGSFVCKGKHWQLPYYKVLSVFDNSWSAVSQSGVVTTTSVTLGGVQCGIENHYSALTTAQNKYSVFEKRKVPYSWR